MHSTFKVTFNTPSDEQDAQDILSRCVHCGFCNATCPTYQLLGDELDGPRGRIYLIKHILEGEGVTQQANAHLDRCLNCRNCETTCPSGVKFGRLLDIARHLIEPMVARGWYARLLRQLLLLILPYPARVSGLVRCGRWLRPWLPRFIQRKIPALTVQPAWPLTQHARRILLLDGCVQPSLAPSINAKTARVLDKLGISVVRPAATGCCGAINYHLGDHAGSLVMVKQLIDRCWPEISSGVEAIVATASGCSMMLKEYAQLLRDDPAYADKARRFSGMCKDLSEVLQAEDLTHLTVAAKKIAVQSPCTLQHGQQLNGVVESILLRLGFELTEVPDAHWCCGSAGTYSILQADLAERLRQKKLANLQQGQPALIATANIGCLLHLQEQAEIPVMHWIELLDSPN